MIHELCKDLPHAACLPNWKPLLARQGVNFIQSALLWQPDCLSEGLGVQVDLELPSATMPFGGQLNEAMQPTVPTQAAHASHTEAVALVRAAFDGRMPTPADMVEWQSSRDSLAEALGEAPPVQQPTTLPALRRPVQQVSTAWYSIVVELHAHLTL